MNLLVSLVCSGSVLKCFQVLLKTAFKRVFLTHWSYLPLNTFLFIGRTLSFPNSVANSGPFESSMPIQMPEFSFFPANRGRPYADSWHCQNISVYFLSLPGEREKSLPTVREDSKKKKARRRFLFCFCLQGRSFGLFSRFCSWKSSTLVSLLFWERVSCILVIYRNIKLNKCIPSPLLYLFCHAEIDVAHKYQY